MDILCGNPSGKYKVQRERERERGAILNMKFRSRFIAIYVLASKVLYEYFVVIIICGFLIFTSLSSKRDVKNTLLD